MIPVVTTPRRLRWNFVDSNDRINAVLALLAPHLVTIQEPYYFRQLLEGLYDDAQDDLLESLRSAQDAAQAWGVSDRRARAHIARLHEKYGIGQQFGGSWLIRREDIERHPPDQKYRQK